MTFAMISLLIIVVGILYALDKKYRKQIDSFISAIVIGVMWVVVGLIGIAWVGYAIVAGFIEQPEANAVALILCLGAIAANIGIGNYFQPKSYQDDYTVEANIGLFVLCVGVLIDISIQMDANFIQTSGTFVTIFVSLGLLSQRKA